jgi:bacterioferritin-associated ferredoxin
LLVCHCLCVFDATVRECVRQGARTPEDVGDQCGAGTGCGGCRQSIEAIVRRECAKAAPDTVDDQADDLAA